jgi:hypothetical protein
MYTLKSLHRTASCPVNHSAGAAMQGCSRRYCVLVALYLLVLALTLSMLVHSSTVSCHACTTLLTTAHRGSSKHIYQGPVRGTSITLEALASRGECLVLSAAAVSSLSDPPCSEFAMRYTYTMLLLLLLHMFYSYMRAYSNWLDAQNTCTMLLLLLLLLLHAVYGCVHATL